MRQPYSPVGLDFASKKTPKVLTQDLHHAAKWDHKDLRLLGCLCGNKDHRKSRDPPAVGSPFATLRGATELKVESRYIKSSNVNSGNITTV